MARPIRVEFENAVYHVTARGNARGDIYRDVPDRQRFLETLDEAVERFGVVVHAFCLMPNHYHLQLQTPRANLTDAAGWLQATYSIRFNRRHRRSGHVFQGRFKAHLVEADGYARELIKYIHLNPVRPKDKRRSVPAKRRAELSRYRNTLWNKVRGLIAESEGADEIRWSRRAGAEAVAQEIDRLTAEQTDRRIAIWLKVRHGGRRMTEVAKEYSYSDGSGVHRVIQRLEARANNDRHLDRRLKSLAGKVSRVKS